MTQLTSAAEHQALGQRSRWRLAALTSHPIQYQAPLFRLLARDPAVDLTVFFCERVGAERYLDPEFGVPIQWDTPVLEGYRSIFLRNVSPHPSVNRFSGLLNPGIVPALRRTRWDALMVHGYAHATNWLAFAAARTAGVPLLVRGESTPHRPTRGLRRAARTAVLRALAARTAGFLTIGTLNAEFYRSLGAPQSRLFHTPYAVDNEHFISAAESLRPRREEIRRRLGIPPDGVLTLFSGKLIPRKRPMDLLRAIDRPDLTHVIAGFIGDGELRGALEEEARARRLERVRFFGFQNQRELADYYTAGDVFVLPSQFETWGLVVNEAMCFGLPVVTTSAVGAARDLVRDGWNGAVYPPGDVDALGRVLEHVAGSAERRLAMGRRSRELIGGWSNEVCVEGIKTALHALARAAQGGEG